MWLLCMFWATALLFTLFSCTEVGTFAVLAVAEFAVVVGVEEFALDVFGANRMS